MKYILITASLLFLFGCSQKFNPNQTFTPSQLQADFEQMKSVLLEAHPGIYRYTSPDTINWIFDKTEKQLDHSMTERQFRRVANPIFSYIRCGHTDIYPSKEYTRFIKKNKPREFPLGTLFLENKLRIVQNRTNDTTLKAGMEIVEIDGKATTEIIAEIRDVLSSDGYNQTYKNTLINNSFGSYYRYIRDNPESFKVMVKDSLGKKSSHLLTFNKPPTNKKKPDTLVVKSQVPQPILPKQPKPSKSDLRHTLRFSDRDSSLVILDINTFSDPKFMFFYRKAFKKIKEKGSKNLIIDLRNNGGGRSDASIRLMSYLLDSAFVVYDSVYANIRKPSLSSELDTKLIRFFARNFWSKKLPNGGILNKATAKVHKPRKRFHFDGTTYILTNGGSFSAAAIFASIAQQNSKKVFVVGRETGGGRYGCNAFISPYLTLSNTQAKVRIPMFKIVLHIPNKDLGHGVMPNYPIDYTFTDAQKGIDVDIEKVLELIKKHD
jgi:C-terminal processing protease CtpA/Prc